MNIEQLIKGINSKFTEYRILFWYDSEHSFQETWFADKYEQGEDWRSLAWWIHDHLPHCGMYFFPKLAAFNINWNEKNKDKNIKSIKSYINPKGTLTKPGMDNYDGDHSKWYESFPKLKT
ncbi:MAG: hypothetical protein HQL46_04440 [Gammaproteobacteria bacterium]|nr:hypothetical protein [Gammaproteobacteria bacterium]